MSQKRVVIAMSGGVDSSVAAYLLKQQGYEVIGMMMRLWSEPGKENSNRCCTPDSVAQAKRVAAKLDIPFYVIDAKQVFYDNVVQSFLQGYREGKTPNPCLVCNRQIRFDHLYKHAKAFGADFFSTGHYVQKITLPDGTQTFKRAVDHKKDQSYVLHVLPKRILPELIFPIGEFPKQQVRAIAEEIGLSVAKRPDSQDLCFLAGGDYREFLQRHKADHSKPGEILELGTGKLLAEHSGLSDYTIGQRKGLGFAAPEPYYVIEKDVENNILWVGTRARLGKTSAITINNNYFTNVAAGETLTVQVKSRYTANVEPATITIGKDLKFVEVNFDEPQRDLTPGQAAVYYQDDVLIGGGEISSVS